MTDEKDDKQDANTNRMDKVIDGYVGAKLKKQRLSLGLSQKVLGDAVGVSIQQIQKYEKATNRIACGKIYQFSKLLTVPVTYFFEGLEALSAKMGHGFAEAQEEFSNKSFVYERETLTLVRSYNGIGDASIRKKILDLVKILSTQYSESNETTSDI